MNLSFDDAKIETGSMYMEPGNYVVKVIEIKNGLSTQKSSPYVEFTVNNSEGKICTHQYYLNTEVREGASKSAWDISKNAILQVVTAALGLEEEEAKTKMPKATSPEDLAVKLSALIIGKEFGLRLTGKWVNPSDVTKKPWIKAEFGSGKFAVSKNKVGELTPFDSTKHIKGSPAPIPTNGTTVKTDW